MTVSLAEIERLEYTAVDEMARPSCGRRRFSALSDALTKLRILKAQYLADHPNILRKSQSEGSYEQFKRDLAAAKLSRELPQQSRPNAPMPDSGLPSVESRAFRSPKELEGMRIHTVGGYIDVPSHGTVHIAAPPDGHDEDKCDCVNCSMARELKGRGFREMRARKSAAAVALDQIRDVHRLGKARQIAVGIVGKQRGVDAGDDVTRWFHDRAAKADVPSETRIEIPDGPVPAATYCTSAADFRRRYYGVN